MRFADRLPDFIFIGECKFYGIAAFRSGFLHNRQNIQSIRVIPKLQSHNLRGNAGVWLYENAVIVPEPFGEIFGGRKRAAVVSRPFLL